MSSIDAVFLLVFVVGAVGLVASAALLLKRAAGDGPVSFRGKPVAAPRKQAGAMLCFAAFAVAGALDIVLPRNEVVQWGSLAVRLVALSGGIYLMTQVRRTRRP